MIFQYFSRISINNVYAHTLTYKSCVYIMINNSRLNAVPFKLTDKMSIPASPKATFVNRAIFIKAASTTRVSITYGRIQYEMGILSLGGFHDS